MLGGRAVASSQAWAEIGGKRHYFHSKAERNYARYLEWLKSRGEIFDWAYEAETFWFKGIKRGVTSYKPDFQIKKWNPAYIHTCERDLIPTFAEYHEVKGWMDPRSKTALKRMAKYYPKVKVVVIDKKQVAEIRKKLGAVIPGFE